MFRREHHAVCDYRNLHSKQKLLTKVVTAHLYNGRVRIESHKKEKGFKRSHFLAQ